MYYVNTSSILKHFWKEAHGVRFSKKKTICFTLWKFFIFKETSQTGHTKNFFRFWLFFESPFFRRETLPSKTHRRPTVTSIDTTSLGLFVVCGLSKLNETDAIWGEWSTFENLILKIYMIKLKYVYCEF